MRRISNSITLALSAFLLVSVTSAQQTAAPSGPPARTSTAGGGPDTVVNCSNAQMNYIPVFTATAPPNITICNSAIYQSSGNIGVGTTTPATKLDVSGNINSAGTYQILGGNVVSVAGSGNLFVGLGAGTSNAGGTNNTFAGSNAGASNTTGTLNTFVGYAAGQSDNTGSFNAFLGANAGTNNTNGYYNTFAGFSAGQVNSTGSYNTFVGYSSGVNNTVGIENTYLGANTGISNASNNNTLIGYAAGQVNTGFANTFVGSSAGVNNSSGESNTFIGIQAGYSNTSGAGNTFVGANAGTNNTSGSGNVYLANQGATNESETIRIGQGQIATYIAGIYNTTASGGVGVYINPQGQLGTQTSSLRFKEEVRDMGDSTDALMRLRPVTFFYKPDYANGERTLQYGLIAEEVAKVYPELVAYDKDGQPYSVRYQYLSTMLLNEVQKQYRRAETEVEVIRTQEQKISDLEQRLSRLETLIGTRVNTAQIDPAGATTRAAQ